jgi:hypothetical protein
MRFVLIPAAAGALLSAANYVYCGQMKKLSCLLQRRHTTCGRQENTRACVMCAKKVNSGFMGTIDWSTYCAFLSDCPNRTVILRVRHRASNRGRYESSC